MAVRFFVVPLQRQKKTMRYGTKEKTDGGYTQRTGTPWKNEKL